MLFRSKAISHWNVEMNKCPGTAFPIRIYKNGVEGISASVHSLSVLEVGVLQATNRPHMISGLLINSNVALFIKNHQSISTLGTFWRGPFPCCCVRLSNHQKKNKKKQTLTIIKQNKQRTKSIELSTVYMLDSNKNN